MASPADEVYAHAACIGADYTLFDATTVLDAQEGLDYCRRCPVRRECIALLQPADSWFDGICGGIVWCNGKPVGKVMLLPPLLRKACGTAWGYERHRKSGEQACETCLRAVRERVRARRHRAPQGQRDLFGEPA